MNANLPQSEYLTGMLVGPLYQCFSGIENGRESGILKVPAAASNLTYLKQVSDLQYAVAKAAVELVRNALTGTRNKFKEDLGARVAALKLFLAKNPPKDYFLVPGSEEFRPASEPAMAEAPKPAAAKTKAANGR